MWSIICVPPLAAMVVSDLHNRRIGTVYLLVFGIMLLAASMLDFGWRQVMINVGFNLLTVGFLWLTLYGWSRLRGMRLSDMIGGGDLAFAMAVMPYFELRDYVLFLLISCLLTLAVWWLDGIGGRKRCCEIPLVTGMGACLGVLIICRVIISLI
ncbi:MAG: prepilin peptidase [Candidatus Cryptobacteroides sp.]